MFFPKYIQAVSFVIGMILLTVSIHARHLIGGVITYECLGDGMVLNTKNYRFTMKIYRDCYGGGAEYDNPALMGLYRKAGNTYSFLDTLHVNHATPKLLEANDNPCLIIPPNVCVEEAIYTFSLLNLPVIDDSYYLSYQRCCRNNTINNIYSPGEVGATYAIELTALAQNLCNNSPVYLDFPPIVVCANEPLVYDHSASDSEGDQIVYELCTPLAGGGPFGTFENPGDPNACNGVTPNPQNCLPPFDPVNWILPTYSELFPMGGDPKVTIDPNTGIISGMPNVLGQFVVGVCAKEYRNGELLGEIRRDFQFNVAVCQPTVVADLFADETIGTKEYVINSCGNNTVEFFNLSYQQQYINSYLWEFDLGNEILTANTRNTTITFPGLGTYEGKMVLNSGTKCSDSATIHVNLYPSIQSDFDFEYDTCIGGSVEFTDLSWTGSGTLTNWQWTFGDGDTLSGVQDPLHLYQIPGMHDVNLQVTDINNCMADTTMTINYYPVPPLIIIKPSTFIGCLPANITFKNLSVPIDSTYDIQWDFGDGQSGQAISPTHLYEDEGLFSIGIKITSPIGCFTSAYFPDWIETRPSPVADFIYNPEKPSNFDPLVYFTDQSIDAAAWEWDFNNEGIAFIKDPTFEFQDTGLKKISLIAFHQNGCRDTTFQFIDVEPKVTYHLPNAFTPNNDSVNDEFKGNGLILGISNFHFTIWNRWGEMIFETNDPLVGWNGRKHNTGEISPVGVYVCLVKYLDPRGNQVEQKGFATLIR